MHFIETGLYNEIRRIIPIACVDIVIPDNNKILLVKRKEPPAQGQWWTPGGRIFHGETIEEASVRKAKTEVHLDCRFNKILDVTETIFDNVKIKDSVISIHTVNVVCLMELKDSRQQHIQLDNNHEDYLWTKDVFTGLHPAVKQIFEVYRCLNETESSIKANPF